MAKDVLITPASGSIEVKNDADALKITVVAETVTTADKTLTLPNKTGTLAITTDVPNITGGASSIVSSNLTTSRALVSDASGKVAVSAITSTELEHVSGVTSAIQTQLNGKEPSIGTKNTAFNKNYGTTATDVKMNGTQAVGSVDAIARIDHVHPTDTSRAADNAVVKLTGDQTIAGVKTFSADIKTTTQSTAYTIENVFRFNTTDTPVQTVIYTGIKYQSSTHMPVVRIYGYAYGLTSPIELKIGFYIYGGNLGWAGAVSMGAWRPDVFLFKYNSGGVDYVAIGLSGSCYYLAFQVDVQSVNFTGNIGSSILTTGWSSAFRNQTQVNGGSTIIPAVGVDNCVSVAYKSTLAPLTLQFNGVTNQVFDGASPKTLNITPASIGASPTAGSSSITTLGTIGTGTWQGSIINSTYGGTGVNNGGRTLAVNTNSGTLAFTNASTTLTVANTASISGTNTGDQTTITGNAGTATTLQTPRTLTIGSTGKTFNGGADVSWSLAEIGAASSSSLSSHTSSTNNPHSVTASQVGLGTTATPTFASVTLGSGSETWSIDDATSNTLSFKIGGSAKATLTNAGVLTATTFVGALTGTASGNLVSGGALGTPSSGNLSNCTFPTLNQNTTGSAGSVSNSLILKFDTGTTEGTDKYTFNGSGAKTIDFKSGTNVTITETAGVATFSSPSLGLGTTSGSGNAVTDISVSGHTVTMTKGSTFLTGNQSITISGDGSGTGSTAISLTVDKIDGIAFRNGNSTNSTGPDNITDNGHGYVNSISLFGQIDGALYSQAYSSSWVHQLFGDYRTGQLAVRGRNNGTWTAWRNIWDSSSLTNLNQLTNGPGYITGNQSITLSGDVTGSGTTAITTTLKNSGVTAGSYTAPTISVDAQGRITSASSNTIPTNTNQLTNGAGFITSSSSITGNAGSATYASAVTTTAENTGTTSRYILFADSVSGNQALKTDTGLTYHPTNNALTASTFIGALTGNADTATKLGTSTVGSTQLPIYLNAGTATAITQADLRIGLFGTTAIGSASQPVYLAANGVPTAGNTIPTVYNSTLTITAGNGLTTGGTFTTNQSSSTAVTVALGTPGDVTTSTTNSVSSTSHTHALVLPQSIATTATPTFSGVNLGAGSNTWTIDDATSNTLTFKLGGVSKFAIGTSSSETSGNFTAGFIEGSSLYSLSSITADDYIESSTDITAYGTVTGSLLSGGLAYTTTAPTANNTNGLKIYVGSTDPGTKYTGWLYIIT